MNFLSKFLKALAYLPSLIMGVEHVIGPGKGQEKKAQVDELVDAIMGTINAVSNGEVVDIKSFDEGKEKAIEGIVQCLNATKAFRDMKGKA